MTWRKERFYIVHLWKVGVFNFILFSIILLFSIHLTLGSQLTLWCGVDSSQEDHVALLMCVATSGHHSIASYQWSKKDGCDLLGEVHPLLYATKVGKYTCIVTSNNKSVERLFEVKGSRSFNINNALDVLIH